MATKEKNKDFDTIIVKKQIIKNNVFKGYQSVEVSRALAEEQLSRKPENRHPDWVNVFREGEEKVVGNDPEIEKERERLAAQKKELDDRAEALKIKEEELNQKANPGK